MSTITTHVLDTALGRPAAGVAVRLERLTGEGTSSDATSSSNDRGRSSSAIADGRTDSDGRVRELGPDDLGPGTYRLVFDTASYFAATGQPVFFPQVSVDFALTDPVSHHHVPVLLSPFAYSTYRGS